MSKLPVKEKGISVKSKSLETKEGRPFLKKLKTSQLRLAAVNAQIAATADKMVYTSTMRSQLPLSKLGGPSVTIIRGDRGNRSKTEASEDSVLEPGDVIEISIIPKTKMTDKQG